MKTEWRFKLPSSLHVEIRFNVNVYEIWIEVDQDGRGENTWEFGGETLTFEEAVSECFGKIYRQELS